MGRTSILILIGVAAGSLWLTLSAWNGLHTVTGRQASVETRHLAREAALSGLNVARAALTRDYDHREDRQNLVLADSAAGRFDLTVADSPTGTALITSTGRFQGGSHGGEARVRVNGETVRLAPLPGALVVAGYAIDPSFGGSDFRIDGHDHRPASVAASPLLTGLGSTQHAIVTGEPGLRSALLASLDIDQRPLISGATASADVATESLPSLLEDIYQEALAASTAAERYSGNTTFDDVTLGSPTAPVVLVVEGDAELKGTTRGYGLLIVQGDLKVKGEAVWEGLLIVRAESGAKEYDFVLEGDASVLGAVLLLGTEDEEDDDEAGFPGGHMDVDVFEAGGSRKYHKHEYDDKYDITFLDLIGGIDIGAYWPDFLAGYGSRLLRVEFFNAFNGSGTYSIAAGTSTYTGTVRDGFSAMMVPDSITTFRLDFANLKELRGTSPGRVKSDNPDRDRSLTIRFYDGTTLIYEVSAYEHDKTGLRDGVPTTTTTTTPTYTGNSTDMGLYGRFKTEVKGNAQLRYSEETIGRLVERIPALADVAMIETQVQRVRDL